MNKNDVSVLNRRMDSVLATNKVLRNTYLLLAMTLIFSAVMAYISISMGIRSINPILFLIGSYGLIFLTSMLQNSPMGIVAVFGFTGFMGFALGPILNMYLLAIPNGAHLIATALGGTGMIFLGLSAYALSTQKDFSYMGGFLFAGMLVVFIMMLIGMFVQVTALQLVISGAFMLLSSGLILFQTSQIIHGGETNYINATVGLYVSIYNVFISLLQLLTALSGNSRD
ncbi:MAG: Bax inhibitor-1/YccA family protein [Gammaproteobacteria bacterium]|nr:Bax inhibitor-1/YccA family protein [Gammaproteobacteria bacterium]